MIDKGYDSEWVAKLKSNNDIVSVISKYVPLNKRGKQFWGNCPFHHEKTPSFAVSDYDQFYHCFGCGVGGDVIKFVEEIEAVDFMDAVKILAKNANMQLPEFKGDPELAKLKKQKEEIYVACKAAADYYQSNLHTEKGTNVLNYLKKRSITDSAIEKFKLGVSLGWNELPNYLTNKGFSLKVLKDAGIIAVNEQGNHYDALAERLIFPIVNSYGDVTGFTGRTLEANPKFAKYKNTSQTLIFDKSKTLYGINLVKLAGQKKHINEIIVVEGQMDVIGLHQAGFDTTVAASGTAFTVFHAKEIKRFTNSVIVCFDGDSAGQKATLRSLDILTNEGLNVKVISLPDGVDPDEYVLKFGVEGFQKLIEEALPLNDFKIKTLANSYNLNDNSQKSKFVNEALEIIRGLPTATEREIYLNMVKNISSISMDILRREINVQNIDKDNQSESTLETYENAYVKACKYVLSSLLHKHSYAYIPENSEFYFLNNNYTAILKYINECKINNKQPIISTLYDMFNVDESQDIKDIIDFNFNLEENSENAKKYYDDSVLSIINANINSRFSTLKQSYDCETDLDKRKEISQEIYKLMQLQKKKVK
ncbi:MAG: DNA primase [Clostridia bacterium]|jgi:DNA primase|nr:DNA primase [Clostridia bacterium]